MVTFFVARWWIGPLLELGIESTAPKTEMLYRPEGNRAEVLTQG